MATPSIALGERRNALLERLSAADMALLQPHLREVMLASSSPLPPLALFPVTAVLALRFSVAPVSVVGLIIGRAEHAAPCPGLELVVAGRAQGVEPGALQGALAASSTLAAALLTSAASLTLQLGGTLLAAANAPIPARLARWLLLVHDRIDGDTIGGTHAELAAALATRRAGVTEALHLLEGTGAIRSLRARTTVRDRAALEDAAGPYYP